MQNFGKIKNVFNNLLIEGIVTKNDKTKNLFKKYLKTIRESKVLKTQFLVYTNIENKIDKDQFSANLFVSENLKLFEGLDKNKIVEENKKLVDLLEKFGCKLDENYKGSNLHESIAKLIFTKRTPNNVDEITNELKNVTNHIVSNKERVVNESIDMPISFLTNLMVEKYNTKYNDLDKDDKQVMKALIEGTSEAKERLYSEMVSECIELVNNLLKESDEESKEKLLKVKNKLAEKEEISEDNFIGKISKIVELKNNLKNG
jgi:hypothetical protein